MNALRNYTRWVAGGAGLLHADILGAGVDIVADPGAGKVLVDGRAYTPDEARLIGVRLIDGAVLADGSRAIRAATNSVGVGDGDEFGCCDTDSDCAHRRATAERIATIRAEAVR